jgi:hypothetical protein
VAQLSVKQTKQRLYQVSDFWKQKDLTAMQQKELGKTIKHLQVGERA